MYFKNELQKSESRLIDNILHLSSLETVKASINMISNYQDIKNYQAIIFDEEKKNIARELEEQLKADNISFLGIYDKYGKPAVLYSALRDDFCIVSYKESKPIALSKNSDWQESHDVDDGKVGHKRFSDYLDVGYMLYEDLEMGFDIVITKPIKRVYNDGKAEIIGYVKTVQTNTPDFLEELISRDDLEFYILSDKHLQTLDIKPEDLGGIHISEASFDEIQNHWVETDDYFLHSHHMKSINDKNINFIFAYNKDVYNDKVSSILYTLMVIFVVVSAVSMILLSLMIQKSLSEPLDKLLDGIEYVKSGSFKNGIHIDTKDELSNLADSFNEMSHTIYKREEEIVKNYDETLLTFVDLIEQRDSYTKGHTSRVATYCKLIAEAMKYPKEDVDKIYKAGILHDMGKITTPDSILLKPGKLSLLEYKIMKEHVEDGCTLLRQLKPYKELVDIIEQHHERYDGKGYPHGLINDDINPLARIMIVADSFDAMTTSRIYKPRMSVDDALEELRRCMGTQFDPDVVNVAIKVLQDIDTNDMINQTPKTIIEEERMAYFYKDQLTSLYNMAYLESILSDNLLNKDEYSHAIVIYFREFSEFNTQQSWKDGDTLLIEFANYLVSIAPNALIFRLNGDNFLILSKDRLLNITQESLNTLSPTKETSVGIDVNILDGKDDIKRVFKIR
jgi:putative nucleotidyltransferase with HDIG domain